jgi:hypothetical protein
MAVFRKIDPRIWNDEKFRSLSDDARLSFLFLLSHPNLTALGAMRGTVPGLAAEIGWKPRRLRAALVALSARGMIEIDEAASFISMRHFLKYNEPTGPNSVTRAWPSALNLVPECGGRAKLVARCRRYLLQKSDEFRASIGDAIWDVFRDVPGDGPAKPSPIQEQEQKQKREQQQEQEGETEQHQHEGDDDAPPAAAPPSPSRENENSGRNLEPETLPAAPPVAVTTPQQLRDAWNTCAPNLLPARELGRTRLRVMQQRLREQPSLDCWKSLFRRMNASSFLAGQNDRHWKADLDFALQPDKAARVLEGRYDTAPPASAQAAALARAETILAEAKRRLAAGEPPE